MNKTILIIPILAALLIPVIMAQTVQAKPKPNFFTELGNAADAGKAAGIAAFQAGLSDTCSGGIIYCHEFHAGYNEAADVAP
jgi:hypothetical protein